ncbi:DNA mismatch repair protein MutL, partial [Paenibacillus sp. MWE-103]|nr:DNA mismatch repair protein MutL [Paenibacillus artemisiicola]
PPPRPPPPPPSPRPPPPPPPPPPIYTKRRRHTRRSGDRSSNECSSDQGRPPEPQAGGYAAPAPAAAPQAPVRRGDAAYAPSGLEPQAAEEAAGANAAADASAAASSSAAAAPERPAVQGAPAFPELYWIGQLHGTYIVAQNEEGLFLIDQHAAHERINYEYYLAKFGRPEQASQQLLVPLTLEFTAAEAASLQAKLPLLQEAGVELEPFGANTFLVRAYPEWLPAGEEGDVIGEMADWLLQERGAVDIGKLREKSAIMCSCKASIKANDRLTREEGEGLLRRLAACAQPYTCPHGRPIVVHMTTYQLEKMFKRVMS